MEPAPSVPERDLAVADLQAEPARPTLRLYIPAIGEVASLVVFAHGGGFTWGTLDDYDEVCRNLAHATGGAVASVDYRLAPAHRFPAALDDVVRAVRWAAVERDRLAGPGAPLVLAGDSAGGCLAAAAAQRLTAEAEVTLDGQLLIYPMIEHHDRTPTAFFELARRFRPGHDDIRGAWTKYLAAPADADSPFVVPARASDLRGLPRALVLTAAQDPLRFEAEAYAARLEAAGVVVRQTCYAEVGHSFLGHPPGAAGVAQGLGGDRRVDGRVGASGPEAMRREPEPAAARPRLPPDPACELRSASHLFGELSAQTQAGDSRRRNWP